MTGWFPYRLGACSAGLNMHITILLHLPPNREQCADEFWCGGAVLIKYAKKYQGPEIWFLLLYAFQQSKQAPSLWLNDVLNWKNPIFYRTFPKLTGEVVVIWMRIVRRLSCISVCDDDNILRGEKIHHQCIRVGGGCQRNFHNSRPTRSLFNITGTNLCWF